MSELSCSTITPHSADLTASGPPRPLDALIGREDDIARVLALLDNLGVRLLTLTGPGGVGKTRLATEVMARIGPDFADGAVFVPLAATGDANLVPAAVAKACGVAAPGNAAGASVLVQGLRDRHQLLVLDNFEHLLESDPAWLAEMLQACPLVTVLVTSRTALNIAGEQRYPVPPLPVSRVAEEPVEPAATTLFHHRAHAVRPDFRLTPENREDIDELCRRLDGLPLAIELAAARITVMAPAAMLERLENRFVLLRGGQRNAPHRLQSMHDAIAWSYDLLSPDEQRVLRTLSVFVGGFTLAAAEVVVQIPDGTSVSVVEGIGSLVDKSLVQPVDQAGGEPRFTMLETIREFGLAQLVLSGEEAEVRNRHADWCLAFAKDTASPFDPARQFSAIDLLDAEHANIRIALTWLDATGRIEDLANLVIDLRWFWYLGGHESESMLWYDRVLELGQDRGGRVYEDALRWAGQIAHTLGRVEAGSYLQQAYVLAKASDDLARQAEATFLLAAMDEDRGAYRDAGVRFREARVLYEAGNDAWTQNVVDFHLGVGAYGLGDLKSARSMLDAAYLAAKELGDPLVQAWCTACLVFIACEQGDAERAAMLIEQHPRGKLPGFQHIFPMVLAAAGLLAELTGQDEPAVRLFSVAEAESHAVPHPLPERLKIEKAMRALRQRLGDEPYGLAWDAGRRMRRPDVDAELDRLLAIPSGRVLVPTVSVPDPSPLSIRELDVLRLLADGHSNSLIAEMLFLSRRTVDNHVAHILGKLDVGSRTAAVAWAIRHDLV